MIRTLIAGMLTFVFIFGIWILIMVQIKKHEDVIDGQIGTYVVYQNDTLQIVNYNLFQNDYTLSNGIEIDAKLLDDLEVITKTE